MRQVLAVGTLAVVLGGCGALFNGGPAQVNFTSDPAGAEVWVDGSRRGVTPMIIPLAKNGDYAVTFRKSGFEDVTAVISKHVSGGYVVLDVLGGLLPVIIDAATGSWYVLDTDNLHRTLQATESTGLLTPEQLNRVLAGERFDVVLGSSEASR